MEGLILVRGAGDLATGVIHKLVRCGWPVLALGPGFTAGLDCHAVEETMRGTDLGRMYYTGTAKADTGKPGVIGGYGEERVLRAPTEGCVHILRDIGSHVEAGETVAMVGDTPVVTVISGTMRGMLPEGYSVTPGFKLADVDSRSADQIHCDRISDKARCIASGVVEILLSAGISPPREKFRTLKKFGE